MGRDILVDGYNVIKRAPSFQAARAQGLAVARAQLLTLLSNRYRHTPHQVIVVFDGNGALETVSHERRIRVIYSCYGETADSVLARLAASARAEGREIEMYSDDIEVQQAATSQGGMVQTTVQFEHQVHAAPRDIERRTRYRVAMRRKYGLDSNYIDEEEDDPPPRSPGKKKKRRR